MVPWLYQVCGYWILSACPALILVGGILCVFFHKSGRNWVGGQISCVQCTKHIICLGTLRRLLAPINLKFFPVLPLPPFPIAIFPKYSFCCCYCIVGCIAGAITGCIIGCIIGCWITCACWKLCCWKAGYYKVGCGLGFGLHLAN